MRNSEISDFFKPGESYKPKEMSYFTVFTRPEHFYTGLRPIELWVIHHSIFLLVDRLILVRDCTILIVCKDPMVFIHTSMYVRNKREFFLNYFQTNLKCL